MITTIFIVYIVVAIMWLFILSNLDEKSGTKTTEGSILNCVFALFWPIIIILVIVIAIIALIYKLFKH